MNIIALNAWSNTRLRWASALAGMVTCLVATSSSRSGDGFPASPDSPPGKSALLERLPIDLSTLDFVAMVANREGRDSDWLPIHDFGLIFPANEHRPSAKSNPQPTFYAPLGTAVVAIVSGVVTKIPRLYSGDSSVMIAAHGGSNAPVWEVPGFVIEL